MLSDRILKCTGSSRKCTCQTSDLSLHLHPESPGNPCHNKDPCQDPVHHSRRLSSEIKKLPTYCYWEDRSLIKRKQEWMTKCQEDRRKVRQVRQVRPDRISYRRGNQGGCTDTSDFVDKQTDMCTYLTRISRDDPVTGQVIWEDVRIPWTLQKGRFPRQVNLAGCSRGTSCNKMVDAWISSKLFCNT